MELCRILSEDKVIMAVKDDKKLDAALVSGKRVVFLLKSDIMTVADVVKRCKNAGKAVFIHLDLMDGIGKDESGLKFIIKNIKPDGIISTKVNIIKIANALGLQTVFRVFLIDSQGMESAFNTLNKITPDAVEIMPGVMPDITRKFATRFPNLIAGGMVSDTHHVTDALNSGAVGVSTSNEELWKKRF
ncbi:MAG: glycerol-3-phosphate responsive antiterminator [Clostridia bacterium]|nr:glycerol-3-phosphate responsive antiterminator [Clostridia bacterium]